MFLDSILVLSLLLSPKHPMFSRMDGSTSWSMRTDILSASSMTSTNRVLLNIASYQLHTPLSVPKSQPCLCHQHQISPPDTAVSATSTTMQLATYQKQLLTSRSLKTPDLLSVDPALFSRSPARFLNAPSERKGPNLFKLFIWTLCNCQMDSTVPPGSLMLMMKSSNSLLV